MGNCSGKQSSTLSRSGSANLQTSAESVEEQQPYEVYDPDEYDVQAVKILRKEFKEDPEMFILNMLLMSFMFMDNYDEEIRTLANTTSQRAKDLNTQLIQDHQKELLMPDSVLDIVNKRVKYRITRGPKKGMVEPLAVQRMFILHHAIEIEDEDNSVDYSRIDKPSYSAEIEACKENKGFVKVLVESSRKYSQDSLHRPPSADSACSTSSIKIYRGKGETSLSNKSGNEDSLPVATQGNDSGMSTGNSESSYGYTRITAARTPQKLDISEQDMYTNINQLPSKCISYVQVKSRPIIIDSDSNEDERERFSEDQLISQPFLNSVEFMSHFKNNIFPNYLGDILGFTEGSLNKALSIPGAIFCDSDNKDNIIHWEVIPTIPLPWPGKIAFEWPLRSRNIVWDKRENKKIAYKWPTAKMIKEVKKIDCVVIPRGFIPKKGDNPSMQIEWELGFPKAERYLEFRMSYAQMRIFIYVIILHKTFIEPITQKHGLLIDHIRTHIFWECETNYKAWPENKLGKKLKMVLQQLYDCIGKAELSHYFIKNRNALLNVPRMYLIPAQETINRIVETPLPYVFAAAKHLKYTVDKFYPEPDLDELYRIMTVENVLHREAQLNILAFEKAKQEQELKQKKENKPKKNKTDRNQGWNRRYLEQQRNVHKRKLMSKENTTRQSKNLKVERRNSIESINLNFSVKHRMVDDPPRQIQLLTFFIQHFIEIAKRSLKISTINQTKLYLKQAWYLTELLKDVDAENAAKFQKKIKEDEENCLKKQSTETKVPSTPKRNSTMFQTNTIKVKSRDINIENLTKSYDAKLMTSIPSTSGIQKKAKAKQTPTQPLYTKRQNQTTISSRDTNVIQININPPSPSNIKKQLQPNQIQIETTTEKEENQNCTAATNNRSSFHNDIQGVQLRGNLKSETIVKSVSFRTQVSSINNNSTDDEAETTSL